MKEVPRRPFYSEYAWAFDLIIDRPVRKECAAIVEWMIDRGIRPGAEILDAGCGTGRYAIELARRGYAVHGVDPSPELIDVATGAIEGAAGRVAFAVGDIAHPPASRYDAVLCRGVLNDIIDDASRDAIFGAFSEALRSKGVLILDVRDWPASLERKRVEPIFRKRVSTDRGELTFTSITALDRENRQLLISERHELVGPAGQTAADYHFVMRCSEQAELETLLGRHGFGTISCFGAYDPYVPAGATDRLVLVAQRIK